jgi:glycosyltransferase involved in cell wall biosynthesis
MRREIALWADVLSLFRLWRLLGRLKPQIVEFSTPKAGLLGILAASLCGVPHRVYLLRGLKLETSTGLKRRLLWAAEWMASSCAHVVLCNSQSLREQAVTRSLAPASKLRVMGSGSSHGVDTECFLPGQTAVREQFGIPGGAPLIGFVGRLTRDKGVPELVSAFEQILAVQPSAWLLLVGWFDRAEDALPASLRAQIENHPRIVVTGMVVETAPYYRAMDLLVLPSWREGFPNAVLEASATGIPVVTTHCTGARDSVLPGVTGLLIPPGCPEAIQEAVLSLLEDPEQRARMGRAARAWVLSNYAEPNVLSQTADFYWSLLDQGSDASS